MNINLLTVARVLGDLKISINGEAKVGLSINGVWSNSVIQTLTGDQGNIVPLDPSNNTHALGALESILSNITLVPFQNDSNYEKYVTETAKIWITEKAHSLISTGFDAHPNAFSVTTSFTEENETTPTLVISAEIMTNDYVNGIFDVVKSAKYVGEVIDSTLSDNGEVSIVIRNSDGKESPLTLSMHGDLLLFGTDSIKNVTHYYINNNGTHVLTNTQYEFNLKEHSEKITV